MRIPPPSRVAKRAQGSPLPVAPPTSIAQDHAAESDMVSEGNATGVSRPETKAREQKEDRLADAKTAAGLTVNKPCSPPDTPVP